MSRRINTAKSKTEVKPAVAKTEVKPAAAKTEVKPAAAKTEVKPAAVKTEVKPATAKTEVKPAAAKTEVKSEDTAKAKESTMISLAGEQIDASSDTIVSALTTLDKQLKDARSAGSDRAQEIVKEFGGENKLTNLISRLAGYMGEAAGAGMVAGMSPMIVMAGAAKGIYTKITK